MTEALIRFVVGGTIVSLFALLGEVLRPKGFAGLFAAAPSVALATLSLAAITQGSSDAALEARSMIAGEVGLIVYAACCVYFLTVRHARTTLTAIATLAVWMSVTGALYWLFLRS